MLRFLLILLFFGCAKDSDLNLKSGYITPELLFYISEFEKDFNIKVNYKVHFVKPPLSFYKENNIIGACYKQGNFRQVEIQEKPTGDKLKNVVYHELGHCSLNLKHFEDDLDIMNAVLYSNVTKNLDFYIEKLQDRIFQ